MYDDREPIVVTNINVLTPTMKPGEQMTYEFDYTKRTECYPPDGRGELQYRYWINDGNGFNKFAWIDIQTISYAVPTDHHRKTTIQMPIINPGSYMLQYRWRFYCKGASKVFEKDGPMIPFEIAN